MYNILIINGLGYLGSNYIRYILSKSNEYRIINLDTFDKIFDPLYDIKHENYFFIKGDLNEYNFITYVLNHYNINIVINFSLDCIDKTWYYVMKYQNLINASLNYGKLDKIISISTDDVYSTFTSSSYFDENAQTYPNTEFSCINTYIENILKYYYDKFKLPYICCRICSIFGNINEENKDDLYNKVYDMLKNNIIHINNEGNDQNTYLHIIDFCEALSTIVKQSEIDNIYNIGYISTNTELDIFNYIISKRNDNISSYEINNIYNLNYYKNKKPMDIKKLYELGWNGPKISIYDEIDKYILKIQDNN